MIKKSAEHVCTFLYHEQLDNHHAQREDGVEYACLECDIQHRLVSGVELFAVCGPCEDDRDGSDRNAVISK